MQCMHALTVSRISFLEFSTFSRIPKFQKNRISHEGRANRRERKYKTNRCGRNHRVEHVTSSYQHRTSDSKRSTVDHSRRVGRDLDVEYVSTFYCTLLCTHKHHISTEETTTLKDLNIKEGFVLLVKRKTASTNRTVAPTGSADEDFRGLTLEDIPRGCDPLRLRAIVLANPSELQRLRFSNQELAEACEHSDPNKVREVMMKQEFENAMKRTEAELAERNLRQRLMKNPMDVDAQRQLERIIQQRNIQQNMNLAMEHTPESFASVTMLYVDCEVNGVPVKAFVDSGAQSTIMSESCAKT